jgi:hypothetical protein
MSSSRGWRSSRAPTRPRRTAFLWFEDVGGATASLRFSPNGSFFGTQLGAVSGVTPTSPQVFGPTSVRAPSSPWCEAAPLRIWHPTSRYRPSSLHLAAPGLRQSGWPGSLDRGRPQRGVGGSRTRQLIMATYPKRLQVNPSFETVPQKILIQRKPDPVTVQRPVQLRPEEQGGGSQLRS